MLRFITILAIATLTTATWALDITLPSTVKTITVTEPYGLVALKWITSETAKNKITAAVEKYTATYQKSVSTDLKQFAQRPTGQRLAILQAKLETLASHAKGQSSLISLGAAVSTLSLSVLTGQTGQVTIGDPASGGSTYSFTLDKSYTGTVKGVKLTTYYTALPTTTTGPYVFCAYIPSASSTSNLAVGVFACVVLDPALLATATNSGMTNVTTPTGGVAVSVPFGLNWTSSGTVTHQGSSKFSDTYFSIQDVMGIAVPPEVVTATQKAITNLQARLAALKQ